MPRRKKKFKVMARVVAGLKRHRDLKKEAELEGIRGEHGKSQLIKHAAEKEQKKNLSLFKAIATGKSTSLTCTDFLIGSGNIGSLLNGSYSIKTAHARFRKTTGQDTGCLGKLIYAKNNLNNIVLTGPGARIMNLKVVSATPDFIIKEGDEYVIVEIKTTTKKNPKGPRKNDVIQTWASLDAFGLSKAYICYYEVEKHEAMEDVKIGDLLMCPLIKKDNLFDKKLFDIFLTHYCEFFEQLSAMNGILLSSHDIILLKKEMTQQHKKGISNAKLNNHIHNRKEYIEHSGTCILLFYYMFRNYISDTHIKEIGYCKVNKSSTRQMYKEKNKDLMTRLKSMKPFSKPLKTIKYKDTYLDNDYKQNKLKLYKTKKIQKKKINKKLSKEDLADLVEKHGQFEQIMETNKAYKLTIDNILNDKKKLLKIISNLNAQITANKKKSSYR